MPPNSKEKRTQYMLGTDESLAVQPKMNQPANGQNQTNAFGDFPLNWKPHSLPTPANAGNGQQTTLGASSASTPPTGSARERTDFANEERLRKLHNIRNTLLPVENSSGTCFWKLKRDTFEENGKNDAKKSFAEVYPYEDGDYIWKSSLESMGKEFEFPVYKGPRSSFPKVFQEQVEKHWIPPLYGAPPISYCGAVNIFTGHGSKDKFRTTRNYVSAHKNLEDQQILPSDVELF